MYAVVFRAEVAQLDDQYTQLAAQLRDLALEKYGCLEFTSCSEGGYEIAVSYWRSQADIVAWKSDLEHLTAQQLGRSKWYRNYKVQVMEVLREYGSLA